MYRRIFPRRRLRRYVESIWVHQWPDISLQKNHRPTRVLPTAAVEASFFYADPIIELVAQQRTELPRSIITGQKTRYKEYEVTGRTGIIIVRFKPWGAQPFFSFPLYEAIDQNLNLRLIAGVGVDELEDRLQTAAAAHKKVELVQDFLEEAFTGRTVDREMARAALEMAKSDAAIHQLVPGYGLSLRQFERRFRMAIGITPKRFSSIVRLQRALATENWPEAVASGGYYDQAHYIKTFKAVSGLTPAAFYREKSPTALAKFFNGRKMSPFYNTVYL